MATKRRARNTKKTDIQQLVSPTQGEELKPEELETDPNQTDTELDQRKSKLRMTWSEPLG